MKDNTNLKFLAIGTFLSMILAILFISTVINKTQHTSYGDNYKSVNELRKNLSYNIVLPSFIDYEDNLVIGNVNGGVFTITNEKFRLCGCEYTDAIKNDDTYFRLCPLGIYDKVEDDRLYNVKSEDENFSRLRIRQSDEYTIFNYMYDDIVYGCIINEKITDEKVLALVNLKNTEIEEVIIEKEEQDVEMELKDKSDDAVNALLSNCDYLYNSGNTEDLDYYSIDNKIVLIVVNKNYNKYLSEYKDTCEYRMIDNKLWIYNQNLDEFSNDDSINYYKEFLLTVENILESYD